MMGRTEAVNFFTIQSGRHRAGIDSRGFCPTLWWFDLKRERLRPETETTDYTPLTRPHWGIS